jgi:hypothetical protein
MGAGRDPAGDAQPQPCAARLGRAVGEEHLLALDLGDALAFVEDLDHELRALGEEPHRDGASRGHRFDRVLHKAPHRQRELARIQLDHAVAGLYPDLDGGMVDVRKLHRRLDARPRARPLEPSSEEVLRHHAVLHQRIGGGDLLIDDVEELPHPRISRPRL